MIAEYRNKFVTPEVAAMVVKSGDWVDYGFGAGFPELMDRALAARAGKLHDVRLRGGLVIRPRIEAVESDPKMESFTWHSWHLGDYERRLCDSGRCRFVPSILRLLPHMYRNNLRTDVAFVPVSAPDEHGYFGLGITNYCWRTIIECARTVIFEINERLPLLQGIDGSHRVHISEADYIVEGNHEPLPLRTYGEPSEAEREIASHVVELIPDGAVLALGVGGVPFAVANMLAESDAKDIGCHTGTISDAFLHLRRAGKLTNAALDGGRCVWNLAMGSEELYDWLYEEPDFFFPQDVAAVHSPERMGEYSNFISVNGGVEIDLLGQENAESSAGRQLSGTGGQLDFLEGALRSPGGRGFICLASSHRLKDGTLKSNIVPSFAPGSTVSAPRALVANVVTEYGAASLVGLTMRERAEALIEIAHPDFRASLQENAAAMGLI